MSQSVSRLVRRAAIFTSISLLLVACGGSQDAAVSSSPKLLATTVVSSTPTSIASPRNLYTISKTATGYSVIDKQGLSATLTVAADARLRFFDKSVALDTAGVGGKVYRLYQAAFNRQPDSAGLGFWITQMDRGTSLKEIAAGFVASDEFKALVGANPSNAQLVEKIYQNVLGRPSDAGGAKFWIDVLDAKADTAAGVLVGFSESDENKKRIDPVIANGFDYLEYGFPYFVNVAAIARASILADQPVEANPISILFAFEDGVPTGNRQIIQEGANNFASHFSSILKYSSAPLGITAYSTLVGGEKLIKTWAPANQVFQNDMTQTMARQANPAASDCLGMGGFSVGYVRLIVIGAPCYNGGGSTTVTHELGHEIQSSSTKGENARALSPVWFVEGQPQIVGLAMARANGVDTYAGERSQMLGPIAANRTLADLVVMEGETNRLADPKQLHSEYFVGAAMLEYLMARSGFKKTLAVLQGSKARWDSGKSSSADIMLNFRAAFQETYGQTLDEFYVEVLQYVNYLGAKFPTDSKYSDEPGTKIFLDDGCHSIVSARLQKQVGATWVNIADAKGWNPAPSNPCSLGGAYRPWTIAEVAKGTVLRWNVYAVGGFDWYSTPITY